MGNVDFKKIVRFEFRAGAWIDLSTWYEVELMLGPDGITAR